MTTISKLRIRTVESIEFLNDSLKKRGINAEDVINIETKQPAGIYVIWFIKRGESRKVS